VAEAGRQKRAIVVVGGGIVGSCTALELARLGHRVTMLDRDRLAMNRASLRNEGKIHLGLVYAADHSMATAHLQLRGALCFWSLLGRWLGARREHITLSTPFHYLVAHDSLLDTGQLEQHYQRLQALYRAHLDEHPGDDYMGGQPGQLYRRLGPQDLVRWHGGQAVADAFATSELALSTEQLAASVRQALADAEGIEWLGGHHVCDIQALGDGFELHGQAPDGPFTLRAAQVVNAAWEGRLALDQQMGLAHSGWLHRLKYRVIAQLPDALAGAPSATMVQGPYGDVVVRADQTAYLSWYPTGMRGWSHDLSPPEEWQAACRGEVPAEVFSSIASQALAGISPWFPGIEKARPLLVDAGAIVAFGHTDVDDPASGLHQRMQVGVQSLGGYHSVDAGKLTTGPMFATQAAERVAQLT
jgi:glycine/D-amino acid oxidase-like deaminating enzyme